MTYWQKRCEAAERYISLSPCDPDITEEQSTAFNEWQRIKNEPQPAREPEDGLITEG